MAKRGIDISAHQGNIDLKVLKDKIDFVIIRVGYGVAGNIDSKFKRNVELCEQLGLPYGFYWYSYALNVSNVQKEADHFLNAIAPYHPTMGCWFDMEDADGYKKRNGMPSNSTLKDMCYTFCEKIENAGYYSGVYAPLSWFKNQLAGNKLSKFDKWVAMWPTKNGKQRGLDVSSDEQTDWSMWQFTSDGDFDGYNGRLDTNYVYHDFPNPKDRSQSEPVPEPVTNRDSSKPAVSVAEEKVVIKKGDRVRFTGTRSYSGMKLASWTHNDVFDVIEVSGDRVVVGKGRAVTSAINTRDCQKI